MIQSVTVVGFVMFDDWAYSNVAFTLDPLTAKPVSPLQENEESLVRLIAHESHHIPQPSERKRASSFSGVGLPKTAVLKNEPPFGVKDYKSLDSHQWTGLYFYTDHLPGLLESATAEHRIALQQLDIVRRHCLERVDEAQKLLDSINSLKMTVQLIDSDTRKLQEDGSKVRDAYNHDVRLHAEISTALKIYDYLDWATRFLSKPSAKLLNNIIEYEILIQHLSRGIQFFKDHPDFQDARNYEKQYRQCLTKAFNICTDHISARISSIAAAIKPKTSSRQVANALLWTKFGSELRQLAPLIQILRQANADLGGPFQLLERHYFKVRSQLLADELQSYHNAGGADILQIARTALIHYRHLYENEQAVYEECFGPVPNKDGDLVATSSFANYIGQLSETLYSHLRQYVVHEQNIGKLCQVALILQNETTYKRFWDPISCDVQNRLAFLAVSQIDALSRHEASPNSVSISTNDKYITVVQATALLRQLYELMDSHLFDNLVRRCFHECLQSLNKAKVVAMRELGPVAGLLFHIQQLVSFQNQFDEFDVPTEVTHEIDFSGIEALFRILRERKGKRPALRDLVPRVVEHLIDAMDEFYVELKKSVLEFTEHVAEQTRPLASGADVKAAAQIFYEAIPLKLATVDKQISEKISDVKVADVLRDAAHDAVLQGYSDWFHESVADNVPGLISPDDLQGWLATATANAGKTIV